jgi:hypothetical protein
LIENAPLAHRVPQVPSPTLKLVLITPTPLPIVFSSGCAGFSNLLKPPLNQRNRDRRRKGRQKALSLIFQHGQKISLGCFIRARQAAGLCGKRIEIAVGQLFPKADA